jgi:hypothetical protein
MSDKYYIPYMNVCVKAFAKRFDLPLRNAFNYLNRFKGMDFLVNTYEAEHQLSIDDAVDDLAIVCNRNGGLIR